MRYVPLPAYILRANAEEARRTPRTDFAEMVRSLAEAAMSVTHHDIGNHEPEYWHEIEAMEERFSKILRRYQGKVARSKETK